MNLIGKAGPLGGLETVLVLLSVVFNQLSSII